MSNCFSYDSCTNYNWSVCLPQDIHTSVRYSDVSAAWVLTAAIIVFFMKAGFMLVELSFANDLREQRHVKYIDACASTFGFFLIGFGAIAQYSSPQDIHMGFFNITDPVLFFFKFTFASNAATIVGGCLVTNRYKLRLPAAFISAFVISGLIHPFITFLIWSDHCDTMSPYRFCQDRATHCAFSCDSNETVSLLPHRLYVLDFAGGGAVHLVGGVASLVLCLLVKLQHWRDDKAAAQVTTMDTSYEDEKEVPQPNNFIEWMYPPNGGSERVGEAALGVIILWFCWFAFNCGSTDSLQSSSINSRLQTEYHILAFHSIPSIIAVNMILAASTGGIVAVLIASWAQLYYRTASVNANEIANSILASLVAITAGCPFVDYWGACIIGFGAVIFYHIGCYFEYKLGIEDTARVVPVHGVCGLWSLLAVGLLVGSSNSTCNLYSTFEGLCYCELRLPVLNYGERLLGQVIGICMMVFVTGLVTGIVYGLLYLIPIQPFVWFFSKVFCLMRKFKKPLVFKGNWLLTSPDEDRNWGTITISTLTRRQNKSINKTPEDELIVNDEVEIVESYEERRDKRTPSILSLPARRNPSYSRPPPAELTNPLLENTPPNSN